MEKQDLYQVAVNWVESQHIQDTEWKDFLFDDYLAYLVERGQCVNCHVIYLPFYQEQDNMEVC